MSLLYDDSMADRQKTKMDQQIQNNLAALRTKRGVPSATLAKLVGVNRQTIYAIEAGQYVPNTAVTLRLAAALEVTVEELFHLRSSVAKTPDQQEMEIVASREKLQPGQPVQWCRVGKRTVGVPATLQALGEGRRDDVQGLFGLHDRTG